MKILVDADACPVKEIIEDVAARHSIPVLMVANPSHDIMSSYAKVVHVDGGSQAADILIANKCKANDIVVTQDYGLASMVLGKGAKAIHPGGRIYDLNNIDNLLMQRFVNFKARQAGQKTTNPKKRKKADDEQFRKKLLLLIEGEQ